MPWFRWLLAAFAVAFPIICLSHLLRDRPLAYAVSEALIWGGISAWIYMVGRMYNVRRGKECALCVSLLPPGEGGA